MPAPTRHRHRPRGPAITEVVEVSFTPSSPRTRLIQWAGEACWGLGLAEIDCRVRYCAIGTDAGRVVDTRADGELQLDRYILQFWPARRNRPGW
ncbi:hypothetical protein [Actinacidiphila oryziradicis]|uniref:Uncharacterized protein n=1 Tax=Actinacidiphila oryziradicis TaxID=2571141 RepID=A0A4V5MXG2_9ACTN|nr:hypothetical protein [Actinacidiphila oryziradicis]TKA00099.1 hypothetical protein FCI23_43505 [Actinacidiphila oryziradicis]